MLLSEPDHGICDALNKGIARCTGNVVGFTGDCTGAGPYATPWDTDFQSTYTCCVATATQSLMKTATFPSLRVESELREAAESVLRKGETLTGLIESAVRETILRRRAQNEFLARGLRSAEEARRCGAYHPAAAVHAELQQRLDARRKQVLG